MQDIVPGKGYAVRRHALVPDKSSPCERVPPDADHHGRNHEGEGVLRRLGTGRGTGKLPNLSDLGKRHATTIGEH
jgi:hypothetical protein